MSRELYVKPEIKSEMLEPGALAGGGSGGGSDPGGGGSQGPISMFWPLFGICCK